MKIPPILKKLLLSFLGLLLLLGLIGLLPQVRVFLVDLVEKSFHKTLRNKEHWQNFLLLLDVIGLLLLTITTAIIIFFDRLTASSELFKKQRPASPITLFPFSEKIKPLWWFLYLGLFLFLLGIRLFFIGHKEALHVDEALSITLSSYNNYGWTQNYSFDRAYSGKELKEITYWDTPSFPSTLLDISKLYLNNRDTPHTNFYYSILRLWNTGLKTGELKTLIWYGCSLNLLFFSLSFVFLLLLSRQLFHSESLSFLTLSIAFLNTASISNTLFIRVYQLQEAFFVLITYLFVLLFIKERNQENYESWKNGFKISIVTSLFSLCGYFGVFYVLLLSSPILFRIFRSRRYHQLTFWGMTAGMSAILTTLLYPRYFMGFVGYRVLEIFKNHSSQTFLDKWAGAVTDYLDILNHYLFYSPVIVLFSLQLILFFYRSFSTRSHKKSSAKPTIPLCLTIFMVIWTFTILYIAPYKTIRYVMAAFPIFALGLTALTSTFKKFEKHFFTTTYLIIFLVGIGLHILWPNEPEKHFSTIAYLYPNYKALGITEEPNKPVIILNKTIWKNAGLIPYLHNNQQYYIHDDLKLILKKIPSAQVFHLVVEENLWNTETSHFFISNDSIKHIQYFTIIENVTKKDLSL